MLLEKGCTPWNKGKKNCYSQEMIKRMSDSHLGKPSGNKGNHLSEEMKTKMSQDRKGWYAGENNPSWKGGITRSRGRIFIHMPGHPNSNLRGYVRQSHLVSEKTLGRHLDFKKGEMVHHINGNPGDDRNENLLICDRTYHKSLEMKIRMHGLKQYFASL